MRGEVAMRGGFYLPLSRKLAMAHIELDQVTFSYPAGFSLEGIDLEISRGTILGILGPNGSGKSTLLQLLSRLHRPTTGTIRLEGVDLADYTTRALAQLVSVIPSDNYFDFPFSVAEVVEMGRYPHLGRLQTLRGQDREWIHRARRLTGIEAFWERSISELSSGERQRVLIARALAQNPSVLILDEPSAHLDINHQISVFRMLRDFNQEYRTSILVVLHDLTLADAFCREVVILKGGRLAKAGPPRDVMTSETLQSVFEADVQLRRGRDGAASLSFRLNDPDESGETGKVAGRRE